LHIDPNSPEFFQDFDPFEFDGEKDYVDGKSDAHVNRAHANRMKALDPEWQENQKIAGQKRAQDNIEWRENVIKGAQKRAQDNIEWRENVTIANQLKAQDSNWLEKNQLAARIRGDNPESQAKKSEAMKKLCATPEYQAKKREIMSKVCENLEWQKNHQITIQAAKVVNSKKISCDGVIYSSLTSAGEALAPANVNYKRDWMGNTMRKHPDRYFYVDEDENKPDRQIDPRSIDPTYMSLEERKALAKLKRQQSDTDK